MERVWDWYGWSNDLTAIPSTVPSFLYSHTPPSRVRTRRRVGLDHQGPREGWAKPEGRGATAQAGITVSVYASADRVGLDRQDPAW
jgi:hypothetical protein